eukprot:TRINITY_DN72191_c0_g1_i1.p2 TRINITY_DN72191_c0_g1~~TRINITY_DN72191_c0_g1_i1.p2  ORF type:complete len:179 (-),score=22.35 TRINITY_DN72191_c0_g1_i1:353-889(-)
MRPIRFKFSPEKAMAAIQWMVSETSDIDLHTLLKTCYFADKAHLNKYHRPIFGAAYRAMKFGPVPVEIYEMAKGDALWLAELGVDRFPWRLNGYRLSGDGTNSPPNLDVLSDSDMEELRTALALSRSMTFDARTAATHGADWQAANLGFMRYEDMLQDSPVKDRVVSDLRENAARIRL